MEMVRLFIFTHQSTEPFIFEFSNGTLKRGDVLVHRNKTRHRWGCIEEMEREMNSIIYIVGLVVVVGMILSFVGLA